MDKRRGPANTVGSSVRGEDLWGREGEIAELWTRLQRGSVLITGPRRHGKSAVLNDLERVTIEPFTPRRAIEFVAAVLAAEGVGHEEGVPAEIVRVADCGVPFFLQVLIQECSADARRHARTLAVVHVEPVYQERVLGPANKARFSHYHTRLREHYGELEELARVILDALVARQPLTADELAAAVVRAGEERARLEPTLTLLESDYYLERDRGEVRFANGFLRSWWQRHAARSRGRS